ncbi:hypothetical protein, partial [uncultured Sphingomonas sp.]|uniref:hypothetical protein n=1 Tax=uncultured Sphingomonas sp. TaxID=158754 RepID=UPI002583F75C
GNGGIAVLCFAIRLGIFCLDRHHRNDPICPAGNGKGACACSRDRFPTSGFGPSLREDIGATNEVKAIAAPETGV